MRTALSTLSPKLPKVGTPMMLPRLPGAGSATAGDPLFRLTDYDVRALPTHLVELEMSETAQWLLALRRSDGTNAWYATKADQVAYLADLLMVRQLAAARGEWGWCVRHALVERAVRDAASATPLLLGTLVERGLMPLATALSNVETASDPAVRVEGRVRLLPHVGDQERARLIEEALTLARSRVRNRSSISVEAERPRAPLDDRQHLDVVTRLAGLPDLPPQAVSELVSLAREAPTSFAAVRALTVVADRFPDEDGSRSDLLAEAWSLAGGLGRFDGRPEAQAFVAARFPGRTGREHVEEALSSILHVLEDSSERLRYGIWGPYIDSPRIGHSRLLRLEAFAEPLRVLAPVLTPDEVNTVMHGLVVMDPAYSDFPMMAVLTRVAELGSPEFAWDLTQAFGPLTVAALAVLGGSPAGLPPGITASDLAETLSASDDAQLHLLSLVALAPLLGPPQRRDVVVRVLRETLDKRAETEGTFGFRREMLNRLVPVVRSLPSELRDPLIAGLDEGDPRLVEDEEDAALLLKPLTDVLPTPMLEFRWSATRSIGLDDHVADRFRRTPTAQSARRHVGPSLDDRLAREALRIAAAARPLTRARMLIFLAPLLNADHRAEARRVARTIDLVHLRAEPLWRLLEPESPRPAELVTECLRTVFDISGGLARVQPLIDDMAAGLRSPEGTSPDGEAVQVIDGFLRDVGPVADLAAALPFLIALDGERVRERTAETIQDLACWFGDLPSARVPATRPRPDGRPESPPLVLERPVGGAELVEAAVAHGGWDVVSAALDVLRSMGEEATDALHQAEGHIVRHLAETSDGANGPVHAAEVELVEVIADGAPAREHRLEARAALLRQAVSTADRSAAEALLAHLAVDLEGAREGDGLSEEALFPLSADMIQAEILLYRTEAATRRLRALLAGPGPYTPLMGRLLTRAVTTLRNEGDANAVGTQGALDAYFDFVQVHHEDYALQEDAGRLLRDLVVTDAAAGRRVDPAALWRLDNLADADDPDETVLHALAVDAWCAAAAAADPDGVLVPLDRAFARWHRHPEVEACSERFVDTALAVGEAARNARALRVAPRAAALAFRVASRLGDPVRLARARKLLTPRP
ncbi:hypothetical protein ACFYWX_31255 [Streptomyces sp. NPDC002888]|uniref:hypothetical protein n=1 Tax=Streptomyces sp. NPDC002888 TaxID=3364668 RepID=UPI003697CAC3